MRKKQVATRILSSNDSGRFPQFSLPECNASAQSLVRIEPSVPELPTFSVDSMGNIILPDGTPVVQPAGVDENFGCAVQFDLKDGALPKKSFRSFDNQPSGLDMVKCTSCAIRISPFSVPCEVHPILKVIICKRCSKFYGKGCFAKDADGKDENCRWCGDGGDLICCDTCSNTFCKSCIKRNLGRTFLYNIEELEENEIWSCVLCKPETLLNLQQECSEIIERVRVSNVTRKKRTDRTHSLLKARQSTPQHSPAMNNSPVIVVPAMQTPVTASAIQNIDDLAAVLVSSAGLFPQAADFFKNLQTLNNTPSTIVLTPPVAVTSILPAGTQLPVLPPLPLMTSVSTAVGTCNLIQSSPITVTTSRLASSITSSTSQDSNDSTASMRFNRNKSASTGNNNSPDWYLQNVSVGNILDQIAQVDASNIQQATKALRICLETFICDLRRVETNLAKSRTPTEINNIVRSFQSIYRFHMFNRVGNLVSRINEEGNKLDKIKPSQYHKVTPPVALSHQKQLLQPLKQPVQQKQPIFHQLQSKTLSPSVPSPKVGLPKMPIPSKNPLTIDLTDDLDVSMESEPAKESIAIATVQKSLGSQNNGKVPTDTNVASDHGAKRPQNVLISDTYSRKRMRPRRSCTVKPVRYVIADDPDQDNNYRSLLEDQSDKTPLSSNLQNVRQNKMRKPLPINMDCEDSDNNVEETHPKEAKFSDENEKEEVSRTQEAEIPNKAQKERVASETQQTEIVSVIQGENVTSETQGAQIVSNTHKEDINSSQPLIPVKITMIQPVMTKNETNSNNLSSEMIWKKNAVNEIAKLTNVININCNNISEKAHLLKASLNENSIVASNEKDNIINNILSKQLENSTKTMNSLSETDEKHKEHSPTHLENRFSASPKGLPAAKCPVVSE